MKKLCTFVSILTLVICLSAFADDLTKVSVEICTVTVEGKEVEIKILTFSKNVDDPDVYQTMQDMSLRPVNHFEAKALLNRKEFVGLGIQQHNVINQDTKKKFTITYLYDKKKKEFWSTPKPYPHDEYRFLGVHHKKGTPIPFPTDYRFLGDAYKKDKEKLTEKEKKMKCDSICTNGECLRKCMNN